MKEECYFCGAEEDLEEHHIFPVRKTASTSSMAFLQEAESEENKVTVCHSCHMKLEDLYDEKFWSLVKKWMKNKILHISGDKRSGKTAPKSMARKIQEADEELGL